MEINETQVIFFISVSLIYQRQSEYELSHMPCNILCPRKIFSSTEGKRARLQTRALNGSALDSHEASM